MSRRCALAAASDLTLLIDIAVFLDIAMASVSIPPSGREITAAHDGLLRSLIIRPSSTREETRSPLDMERISPDDLLCAQFNEQSFSVFQIEGVEALGE